MAVIVTVQRNSKGAFAMQTIVTFFPITQAKVELLDSVRELQPKQRLRNLHRIPTQAKNYKQSQAAPGTNYDFANQGGYG